MTEELSQIIYHDECIEVKIGVDIKTDPDLMGSGIKYHRNLDNCIKIKALSPGSHFVQFVTRQVLDIFTLRESKGGLLQWEQVDHHYMADNIAPKWKLDVVGGESIFYDQQGLHCKTNDFVAMYDYPGGEYEPKEERAVFCTFVIINNEISHFVQWSKQFNVDKQEFYCVNVNQAQGTLKASLPCWAIRVIQQHLAITSTDLPPQLVDVLPSQQIFAETRQEEFVAESGQYFLQPPDNWITKKMYPNLFHRLIAKEEHEKKGVSDEAEDDTNKPVTVEKPKSPKQ